MSDPAKYGCLGMPPRTEQINITASEDDYYHDAMQAYIRLDERNNETLPEALTASIRVSNRRGSR